MNQNVYFSIGIGNFYAALNKNFDGVPKMDAQGNLIASPQSLLYAYKEHLRNKGEKVFGSAIKKENGSLNTITEQYEYYFGNNEEKAEKKNSKKKKDKDGEAYKTTLYNLFECADVIQSGIAYTGKPSVSIRGALQLNEGVNKYKDSSIIIDKILSPYGAMTKEDKEKINNGEDVQKYQTTIGTRVIVDEAHYLFDGGVYPNMYDKYKNEKFKGYTEKNYESFKDAALIAVSNYNSKSKAGCSNEFGLFVKIKEEQNWLLSLNNMKEYIEVYKENGQLVYDLTKLSDLLIELEDKIDNIELYYNKRTMSLKGWEVKANTRIFDIITRKEIV